MGMRVLSALVVASLAGSAFADLESDFGVGRSANGQLKFEFNFASVEPLRWNSNAQAWVGDEPGFANIDEDEPDEDFFMLPSNAFISIEILSADAGFRVVDPEWDSFTQSIFDATVSEFDLGAPDFDDHPFWVVLLSEWDGVTTEYSVTFRAVDNGTAGLQPSEPVTVTFVIPSPGAAGTLALAGLLAARRRR